MTTNDYQYRTDEERDATEAVIAALAAVDIRAEHWPTGGGCMALRVEVSPGWDDRGYADEILITNGDASLPNGSGIVVGHYDGDEREEGEMLVEQETGSYDVAEIVRTVAGVVKPGARRVGFVFTMDVAEGVTDDQISHAAGAAYVQFNEPVLSNDDDGNVTHGATSRVIMLPFDPDLTNVLTLGSQRRNMTIPEYIAALAEIDAEG